jgi:hypothetical protein
VNSPAVRLWWLLRGSMWRRDHLLWCDGCHRRFADDAPGLIDAVSDTDDEAEECLAFRGFTHLRRCPACAAPLWQQAVKQAIHNRGWR